MGNKQATTTSPTTTNATTTTTTNETKTEKPVDPPKELVSQNTTRIKIEASIILFETIATTAGDIAGPIAAPLKFISWGFKLAYLGSTTEAQKGMFKTISMSLAQFYKEIAFFTMYETFTKDMKVKITVSPDLVKSLKGNIGELFAYLCPLLEAKEARFHTRMWKKLTRFIQKSTLQNLITQKCAMIDLTMNALNTSMREQLAMMQVEDPENYKKMIEETTKVNDYNPFNINEDTQEENKKKLEELFQKTESKIDTILQDTTTNQSNPSSINQSNSFNLSNINPGDKTVVETKLGGRRKTKKRSCKRKKHKTGGRNKKLKRNTI